MGRHLTPATGEPGAPQRVLRYPVSEIFPAIQGEGMLLGRPTVFVRLGGCDYRCLGAGTPISMADLSTKPIEEVRAGDLIVGYARSSDATSGPLRLVPATVVATRMLPPQSTIRLVMDDGSELVCAPGHRWWVEQLRHGWVWKSPHRRGVEGNYREAASLVPGVLLKGPGMAMLPQSETEAWHRGYIAGAMDGDGHVSRAWIAFRVTSRSFFDGFLASAKAISAPFAEFADGQTTHGTPLYRARLPEALRQTYVARVAWDDDREYLRGYLAGMFDAEGHVAATGKPYITQNPGKVLDRATEAAAALDLEVQNVPLAGRAHRLVFDEHPAALIPWLGVRCRHKRLAAANRGLSGQRRAVVAVEPGPMVPLYDLQTTTGNFLAGGFVSHNCSWCDSLYAVLPQYRKEWVKRTAAEIVARVNAVAWPNRHVTLSGGNPAIHPCDGLVKALHAAGYRVAVETQGTVLPAWLQDVDDLTISPKPPSSGNVTAYDDDAPLSHLVRAYPAGVSDRAICLKVVIFTDEDYRYAQRVHAAFPGVPFYLQVGTAVGVSRRDDLLDRLGALQAQAAADPLLADAICLPQLHVLIHGHARGI